MLKTCIPFIGVLLSISIFPVLMPKFWGKFENPILAFWFFLTFSLSISPASFKEMIVHEYIPFITILFALFTINGGVHLDIKMTPSPLNNTIYIAIASMLASIFGTTGSTLLFLKPFLKINHDASYKTHHIVFFIFLVSNIGGCLTPLGDAPLFMGFLKGVDFFWTLKALFKPFSIVFVLTLTLYFVLDAFISKNDPISNHKFSLKIDGKINFVLLAGAIITILLTPYFKLNGTTRDFILLCLGSASLLITPKRVGFHWHPFFEVCRVFLVIFTTLIPVSLMLHQGFLPKPNSAIEYFWISGILSAFLDNAPTYLVFFHLAGGNANILMNDSAYILKAISLGSVFMGAMTYIGNTPNMIVRSIASHQNIKTPSFLGFIIWSSLILIPIFAFMTLFL